MADVSPNRGLLSRPLVPYVLVEKSSILGFLHCPRAAPSRASIASRSPGSTTRGAAGHRALIAEAQGGRSPGGGGGRSDPRDEAALPEPRSPPHREQLGVSSRPHARESWLHWRARVPIHAGAARRCQASGRERDLPRRRRVCCAAGPRSPPTAGTRGHCRKPTRPAQAASRPRPPIPHTGAPHWLRSFISRGASLFPARQPISRLPAFSGS